MKKAILITLLVLAVIAVGGYIYLKNRKLADFEPAIKDKLQSLIIKATDSLYRLEFDTLDADVVNSKLTVVNARLVPDSIVAARMEAMGTRPEDIFSIKLDTLAVAGIDLGDFTRNKKIDLDTLYINGPAIEVYHKKPTGVPKVSTNMQAIYQKLAQQLNRLSIKKLYIKNMHMVHHNYLANKPAKKIDLKNIDIVLDSILMDSTTITDTTRFMFAKNAQVTLVKLQLPTADSLYYIKLDSFALNAVKNTADLRRFSLKGRYSKEVYGKHVTAQKDLYNINVNTIRLQNINWGHLLTGEDLAADNIIASNGTVNIYCDRRLPAPPSKLGHYPHQMLMKDSIPIRIKALTLDGFDVVYEEFNPNSGQAGKVIFKNTSATITNITNDKGIIAGNSNMKATGSAMFMGITKVKATFLFNLARVKEGMFTTDASMDGMDATQLNPICEALGRFSIKQGNIKGLNAHIEGDNFGARGTVTFLYDDLKIDILKKDNNDSTQLKKRGLISFIANAFVIKKSNPTRNLGIRTEQCQFTRNPTKSFFNLVWKTVEDGIKKTAGYKK